MVLNFLLSDEIAEMKRKFKTIMHSIEQLKEEVTEKDETLKSGAADYERKKRDCVRGKESAARAKRNQHNLTALAELENEEIKKLEHRILEFESVGISPRWRSWWRTRKSKYWSIGYWSLSR